MNKTIKMILLFGIAFLAISFSGCQMQSGYEVPIALIAASEATTTEPVADPYAHYYDELRTTYSPKSILYVYITVTNTSLEASNIEKCFDLFKTDGVTVICTSDLSEFNPELSLPNSNSYAFGTTHKWDGSYVPRFVVRIK